MSPRKIILRHRSAPGDHVVMTALVRDIALSRPGEFRISVNSPYRDVWLHNPYVETFTPQESTKSELYTLDYSRGIKRSATERIHFLSAWHDDFHKRTGVEIPLLFAKPDLHLTEQEKEDKLVSGRYWVIMGGGKSDFTTKHWVYTRYQEVVDALRKCGVHAVQAGGDMKGQVRHHHPRLRGALDLVGKTSFREFMRLIHHCEGVICPITAAMHIAAAFDKPCVVIAGGREGPHWEGYYNGGQFGPRTEPIKVEHRFLHTIGLLPCCEDRGCWKSKVTPQEPDKKKSYCHQVATAENGQKVPVCMEMITPSHVVGAVMSYYTSGVLEPIGPAPTIILPDGSQVGQKLATPPVSPPAVLRDPQIVQRLGTTKAVLPEPKKLAIDASLFGNPVIGGKFTMFVLLYGDYFDLHQRCLESIFATCPADLIELRVGSNCLGEKSMNMVTSMVTGHQIASHYRHTGNDKKYPVMREMFHDPLNPITTPWLIWFDDDTVCDRNPNWLAITAQEIVNHPGYDMFGPPYFHTLSPTQMEWIKKAGWYKGKGFRDKAGKEIPNGTRTHFATGSFWILSTKAMKQCDIPDGRLGHNLGDVTTGEQLWQGGFKLKSWGGGKRLVNWSSVPRRGITEKPSWG